MTDITHHDHSHHVSRGRGHQHDVQHVHGADRAVCPVMPQNSVDRLGAEAAGLTRDYEGQTYWLYCGTCGTLWDRNPAKYAVAN